ncbi:MAG: IS66 family insertion sequence element accessory protein TnpB [Pseudomonadales bacterium]|nr:IS66 family insertion sequence element accessory protein TnpB [Pseudomonadales bacterium]
MFFPEGQVKVWLCTTPTDMRKSYDGLSGLAKHQLQQDPLSGQLFVFINRRQTQVKILYFDRSGYCIWSKRLVQGQFNFKPDATGKTLLDWMQLKLLLEGIDLENSRQYKRFKR